MNRSHEYISNELPRFRRYFPFASWVVINIWMLLPIFAALAIFIGFASVHYALSLMCVWLGIVCFWVDRKHLDYCLFTPLQPMATILIMSLGLGVSMVVYDSDQKYQYGYLVMQLVGLLGFPLFIGAYILITKNVTGFVFPILRKAGVSPLVKPLMLVGWFCLLQELGKVASGIASGSMDRGYAGDDVGTYGWWSAFGIFLRFQTMGFLLVPLIWRESQVLGRVVVAGVVTTILFLHFVAASRGAVFFPIFILLVGCYMFLEFKRVKYEVILLVGVIALFPFVTIMSYYRNTEAFRETDVRNVFQKLGTMKQGMALKAEMEADSQSRFTEAGRAYIGVSDALIYEMTPNSIPYEGSGRLKDLLWLFVPYIISTGPRPVLQDGNSIVADYTGLYFERSASAITLPAELYRRWGWSGIPIGLIVYGLFYGAVFRYTYSLYLQRNALWGFMLCGMLFHFFIAWNFHTVLHTCWYWLYDIPKHVLLLGVIYVAARMLVGQEKDIPGALELIKETRTPLATAEVNSERSRTNSRPRFLREASLLNNLK